MSGKLIVNVSPHIRSTRTTTGIMLDVIIALIPALVVSVIFQGWMALVITAICVGMCVGLEALYEVILKKPITIKDFSAIVTGLLLAYNMPANPNNVMADPTKWPLVILQIFVGAFFAIIIAKMLFGGLGCNFMNPALVGRIALMFSFSTMMGASSMLGATGVDAMTSATPLAQEGALVFSNFKNLFFGSYLGTIGETSAIALIAGGVYLMVRKVIKPIIPVIYIVTTFLFSWLFGLKSGWTFETASMSVFAGGLFLGAFFMATDYVTSPITNWGKVIFGVLLGLVTSLIRVFGSLPEGVTFAILLGNIVVPYLNDMTRPVPYGVKERKELEKK